MNNEGDMMSGTIKETQKEFPWIELELGICESER